MNIEHGLTLFHSNLMDKLNAVQSSDPLRDSLKNAFKEKLIEVREQIAECKKQISA